MSNQDKWMGDIVAGAICAMIATIALTTVYYIVGIRHNL